MLISMHLYLISA